jgi:hypothetical protein
VTSPSPVACSDHTSEANRTLGNEEALAVSYPLSILEFWFVSKSLTRVSTGAAYQHHQARDHVCLQYSIRIVMTHKLTTANSIVSSDVILFSVLVELLDRV